MGITERKNRQKEEKKELILKTAMELFLNEGFENVSMRKIAERIEYSPASVYLYFKDKDELLHSLHIKGFEKLFSMQQEVKDIKEPLERLKEHGKVYMKFALKNPEYYDLMFIKRGTAKKISEANEWYVGHRSYEFLKDNVRECMQNGLIYETDLDAATFALWSFVHGMASLIIRQRCLMIPAEQLHQVIQQSINFITDNLASKRKIKLVYNE
jgi:AcrR family transcriptional regulator